MLIIGVILIVLLLASGTPIFLSLMAGGMFIFIFYVGAPGVSIALHAAGAAESFTLIAIPLYLLAGNLMVYGGPSRALVRMMDTLIGHLPGGLAIVTVLSCMLFGAMCGSSPATAAAIGGVMLTPMVELGYSKRFSMGLISASGTLGILIPPSICMILYGAITETPVASLFMAGFIPGFVLGGLLIVTAVIIAKINKYGVHPPFSWRERIQSFRHSLPALGFPVIILGGIYGGIFTPTEAGAVAIFYGLFIGFFVYRELKLPQLKESLLSTVRSTSMILIIIVGAILVGRVFGFTAVPRNVASFMSHLGVGWMAFLAMVIVLYYFMGMFFETVSIFVLTIPLIWPTMMQLGINPVHFGIIATICIEMMAITPPVGFNLYVMSGIGKEPIEEVVHGVLPFYIPMVVGTFLVAYVPIISLFLPKLFGMLG